MLTLKRNHFAAPAVQIKAYRLRHMCGKAVNMVDDASSLYVARHVVVRGNTCMEARVNPRTQWTVLSGGSV